MNKNTKIKPKERLLIVEYINVLGKMTFCECEFMEIEAVEYCIDTLKQKLNVQ